MLLALLIEDSRKVSLDDLGAFLKNERLRRGWSQARVFQLTGVEQSKLSRIERATNTSMLEPWEIEALAKVYEVSPTYLMEMAGYRWDAPDVSDERAIVYTYVENNEDLTDYQKQVIFGALDDAERRRRELEGTDG